MGSRIVRWRLIFAPLVLTIGVASCAASHTETAPALDVDLVSQAQAGGAGAAQLAILKKQPVGFRDYRAAVERSLTCIREAGIDVVGDKVSNVSGYPLLDYSFAGSSPGRSDKETLALADKCVAENSKWVEEAYQTSPAVLEAVEAHFEPYREPITACLEKLGVHVDGNASRREILVKASEMADSKGVDCIDKSGYTW